MINNLTIKNYKCHQYTNLTFKPLTVLTGINGFGKSSAIQSLLLLRQSHLKNRLNAGLELNMPLVSVGVADEALYKFTKEPLISFSIGFGDNKEDSFVFNAEENMKESFIPLLEHKKSDSDIFSESLFTSNFQYISAFREGGNSNFPKDTYAVKTLKQISSELGKGELVGHFLFNYLQEKTHNYIDGSGDMDLLSQVTEWERKISPNVTIDIKETPDQKGIVVKYGYSSDGEKALQDLDAMNIGFGVSYTLPVIVALLSAKPGDLIIIENPEAHLHPEGQLELGNLICKVAQHGVQVVIETHSDHIVNAIRVGCKKFHDSNGENGINKDNVVIHFFGIRTNNYEATSQEIVVEDDGSVDYQPKGFFDTFTNSMFDLME